MVEPASSSDSLIGATLVDRYRVIRVVGRGGMGVVYEAEHTGLGKRIAIKLMLEKYAQDPEAVARFQREALAASRIGNPHIIEVMDIGVAPDGRSFVVMELLDGLPLSQVLEQTGPMPPWRAIGIMRQVLRAVGAAHAKGIVHRDLKPDNIFISSRDDQHDFVKLLDFGISKVVDPDAANTKLTTTGVVMGTPLYMAPEQALGNAVDHRADVYACGVMLYELLAGHPPFQGPSFAALIAKLLTEQPKSLNEVRPGLPLALVKSVDRALAKEPADRFPSAELFAAALPGDRTPSQLELAGTLDSSMRVRGQQRAPRTKKAWMPFAAGAAVLAVAAVVAGVILHERGTPPADATNLGSAGPVPPPPQPGSATAPQVGSDVPTTVQFGTLEVKTKPAKALVVLDNQPVGQTPVVLTRSAGTHHLHIELAGYVPVDEDEDVALGERTAIHVDLTPATKRPVPGIAPLHTAPGSVSVTHTPVGPHPVSPYDGSAATHATPVPPIPSDHVVQPPDPKQPPDLGPKQNPYLHSKTQNPYDSK
ncbi:MAG TPA: serine/threonine-protein kinase [Kofleriaceae bacterium]